jgi:hypothetical protein
MQISIDFSKMSRWIEKVGFLPMMSLPSNMLMHRTDYQSTVSAASRPDSLRETLLFPAEHYMNETLLCETLREREPDSIVIISYTNPLALKTVSGGAPTMGT